MKILSLLILLLSVSVIFSACDNYGKKATKGPVEVYYKEGINETEAQKTANLLADIDSPNNTAKVTKSMQLIKITDTVCFKMVASKEKLVGVNDMAFEVIGNMIADSVFNGKPVNVELTDDKFNTFKKIIYKKLDFNNLPEQK